MAAQDVRIKTSYSFLPVNAYLATALNQIAPMPFKTEADEYYSIKIRLMSLFYSIVNSPSGIQKKAFIVLRICGSSVDDLCLLGWKKGKNLILYEVHH